MRTRARLLALTAALVAAATSVDAQTLSSHVGFGDEVKVRAAGAIGRFRVVEVREGALVLRF